MKMYVISDNVDTQKGMRLAGIAGCVAHGREEVTAAIDAALQDPDLAILLITQKAQKDAPEYISQIKLSHALPLIVSIPDRHGLDKDQNAIADYIREAVGIKL